MTEPERKYSSTVSELSPLADCSARRWLCALKCLLRVQLSFFFFPSCKCQEAGGGGEGLVEPLDYDAPLPRQLMICQFGK